MGGGGLHKKAEYKVLQKFRIQKTPVLMMGRVGAPRTGSASLIEAGPTRPTVTKFAGGETRELALITQKIRS